MLTKFLAYLRTPTTIHGISAILGLGAGVVTQLLTKQDSYAGAVGALVYGLVLIAIPDNSAEATSVEQFVKDGIAAAVSGHVQTALPALVNDAVAVIKNAIVPAASATATLTATATATGAAAATDAPAVAVALLGAAAGALQQAAAPTMVQTSTPIAAPVQIAPPFVFAPGAPFGAPLGAAAPLVMQPPIPQPFPVQIAPPTLFAPGAAALVVLSLLMFGAVACSPTTPATGQSAAATAVMADDILVEILPIVQMVAPAASAGLVRDIAAVNPEISAALKAAAAAPPGSTARTQLLAVGGAILLVYLKQHPAL